jgi:CRP/FNR family transcriptional regulator, cyclic AMP receptor protein
MWRDLVMKSFLSVKDTVTGVMSKNPLFDGLSNRELAVIHNLSHVRNYNVGEYIFQKGQSGAGAYIVISGKVMLETEDLYIDKNTGAEKKQFKVMDELGTGELFGESALTDVADKRLVSAKAMEPSVVLSFFRPDLLDMIKQRPSLASKILLNVSRVLAYRLARSSK